MVPPVLTTILADPAALSAVGAMFCRQILILSRVMPRIDLDATDRAIVTALQGDGRMTNTDLAEVVHLSPSATLRRVRRLEDEGVIAGYAMMLDAASVGLPTSVFVEITLESQHEAVLDAFEAAIVLIPEVIGCHLMAGQADYLVHVVCADVADYERIHRGHIAQLPGVARLRSNFAIRRVVEKIGCELPA